MLCNDNNGGNNAVQIRSGEEFKVRPATQRWPILVGSAWLAIAAGLLLSASYAAAQERECGSQEPINTIQEMWPALYACWQPPAGSEGMDITLVFSLRRDGTLIGKPRVTWSRLAGTEEEQRAFVASVIEALDKALPLPFTDSMGGAIAGRPLAPRFSVSRES
jgi:hypothetical protein